MVIFGCFLAIIVDEENIETISNQWINEIKIFTNEHIIQRYNIPQSNIPE